MKELVLAALLLATPALAATDDTLSEADRAVLADPRFQPPPAWKWDYFTNADGAKLRYGGTSPASPRGIIVLLPGFGDTAERFFETAQELIDQNYAIWIMDWRGQGGSERYIAANPQKPFSLGFEHDVADLIQFAAKIVPNPDHLPLFVSGESMGGLLGFRAVHDRPDLFKAAAFSSPAFAFHTGAFPKPVAIAVTWTAMHLGKAEDYALTQHDWVYEPNPGGEKDRDSHDHDRALFWYALYRAHPELRTGGTTYGFLSAFFHASNVVLTPGYASGMKTPILIGQAPDDAVADAPAMAAICAETPSCKLLPIPGARHTLFNESDAYRRPWMTALTEFFGSYPRP
jgi:lysophospholipase